MKARSWKAAKCLMPMSRTISTSAAMRGGGGHGWPAQWSVPSINSGRLGRSQREERLSWGPSVQRRAAGLAARKPASGCSSLCREAGRRRHAREAESLLQNHLPDVTTTADLPREYMNTSPCAFRHAAYVAGSVDLKPSTAPSQGRPQGPGNCLYFMAVDTHATG